MTLFMFGKIHSMIFYLIMLSRVTGTMNAIDSSQDDLEPNVRAVLACKNKTDLLF